jgi:flagellar basal body-associated protein FliL
MRLIKIYLGIVITLLIVGLGFGVYVWYTIQSIAKEADRSLLQTGEDRVLQKSSGVEQENQNTNADTLDGSSVPSVQ